jgi:hypothetical protein
MKSTNSIPVAPIQEKPAYPFLGYYQNEDQHVAIWIESDTAYVVWTNTDYWEIGESVGYLDQNHYTVFTGEITLSN